MAKCKRIVMNFERLAKKSYIAQMLLLIIFRNWLISREIAVKYFLCYSMSTINYYYCFYYHYYSKTGFGYEFFLDIVLS